MPVCDKVATSSGFQSMLRRQEISVVTSLPVFSPFREHGGICFHLPRVSGRHLRHKVVLDKRHRKGMR